MDWLTGGPLADAVNRVAVWGPWVLLISARVGVTMAAMPAPFGSVAPTKMRAGLSLALAVAIGVGYAPVRPDQLPHGLQLIAAGFGELLVGAVIGLTVRVTLAAAEVAGSISGFSMGLGFATSVDPSYGESLSAPARLMMALGAAIFFIFEGHHTVVRALATSLQVAPPGDVLGTVLNDGVLTLGSRLLARGLQIASPVLGTMMIVKLGTALSARAAPRVPLMYLQFAVTTGAGVVALFVAAPSLATAILAEVRHLPLLLAEVLGVG
ncbi:MAG: flagellar biosynthetic protein FliR [Myxococcales bacterium]|nr:flagellar biosynthetic protein FliR [Myxococcales bacterium]MDD9965686.1 flagellar biosynthetic protein FliR [Myxococcales bacterium]